MTVVEPSITEAAAAAASNVASALPNLPPARAIPTTFGASVKSWWASGEKEGAASEERLLRFVPRDLRPELHSLTLRTLHRRLPYFRPAGAPQVTASESPVAATSTQVTLDSPKRFLNTLSFTATSPSASAPPPAVILPGYGTLHPLPLEYLTNLALQAPASASSSRTSPPSAAGSARAARPRTRSTGSAWAAPRASRSR
jgi:hypothetical protein